MKLDDLDNYIASLFPEQQDRYTQDLRDFFYTILNLQDSEFIGFSIPKRPITLLTHDTLKEIFDSYKGKTTKTGYEVKTFISSTFVLPPLDTTAPSDEWRWIAKLCHLLLYFSQKNLTRRISETAVEARKWLAPKSSYQSLWQNCYQNWQADTLEQTYLNVHQQLQIFENANHPNLSKLQSIYRTLEFAYHHRQPITRKTQGRKSRAKPKNLFTIFLIIRQ